MTLIPFFENLDFNQFLLTHPYPSFNQIKIKLTFRLDLLYTKTSHLLCEQLYKNIMQFVVFKKNIKKSFDIDYTKIKQNNETVMLNKEIIMLSKDIPNIINEILNDIYILGGMVSVLACLDVVQFYSSFENYNLSEQFNSITQNFICCG